MGAVNGPLTGMFLLGVTVPWANKKGAIVGALVAAAFCIWLCIGAHVTNPHGGNLPTSTNGCAALYNISEQTITGLRSSYSYQAPSIDTSHGLGKLYSISYVLYDGIGITIVMIVGIPVSYITGFEDLKHVNPKLFHPMVCRLVSKIRGKKWKKQSTIEKDEGTGQHVSSSSTTDEDKSLLAQNGTVHFDSDFSDLEMRTLKHGITEKETFLPT